MTACTVSLFPHDHTPAAWIARPRARIHVHASLFTSLPFLPYTPAAPPGTWPHEVEVEDGAIVITRKDGSTARVTYSTAAVPADVSLRGCGAHARPCRDAAAIQRSAPPRRAACLPRLAGNRLHRWTGRAWAPRSCWTAAASSWTARRCSPTLIRCVVPRGGVAWPRCRHYLRLGLEAASPCRRSANPAAATCPPSPQGAKKVVVSAPVKDPHPVLNIVYGVNHVSAAGWLGGPAVAGLLVATRQCQAHASWPCCDVATPVLSRQPDPLSHPAAPVRQ